MIISLASTNGEQTKAKFPVGSLGHTTKGHVGGHGVRVDVIFLALICNEGTLAQALEWMENTMYVRRVLMEKSKTHYEDKPHSTQKKYLQ